MAIRVAVLRVDFQAGISALWEAVDQRDDVNVLFIGPDDNYLPPTAGGFTSGVDATSAGRVRVQVFRARPTGAWWFYRGLRSLLEEFQPDLIHVENEIWGWSCFQALASGKPVVVQGVDTLRPRPVTDLYRKAVGRYVAAKISGYLNWSEYGLAANRDLLPPDLPTLAVPAVLRWDDDFVGEPRRLWNEDSIEPPVLGFLGRFVPEKGCDTLIEASSLMAAEGIWHQVLAVGDGPERSRLIGLADEIGAPVEFPGPVPVSEVPEALRGFDVLVVPSRSTRGWEEQFGRVALEAMQAGCPVVTSRNGALPEVVGNDDRFLFDETDAQDLTRVLVNILRNPQLLEERRATGYQRASHYSAPVAAERLVGLWKSVVKAQSI